MRIQHTRDIPMETTQEFMKPPSPIKRFNELFPDDEEEELPMPEKRMKTN